MMSYSSRAIFVLGTVAGLSVAGILVPCMATAQSRSELEYRKSRIEAQRAATIEKLKHAKAEQLTARNKLVVAQRELATAERELSDAEWKLQRTRATIRKVKGEIQNTEATLARHKGEFEQRILFTFKAGTPAYMEVLLRATDFSDFATRASFNKRMAAEDSRLIGALLEYHRRREAQGAQLRGQEAEQARVRTQVRAARDKVAQKREVAAGLVKKANSDRQAYEQQLVEMAEAHKAIEQLLAALPSGTGLHGSYKGRWAGTFIWPMKGRITSPFGMRFHPILKCRKMHQGIDIAFAGCGGTPVVAAADGRVVHSGWRGALGVSVILDHGSGMGTIYGHFRTGSLHVSTGQYVKRGQVLGRCGTTGRSTGDHLHFGVVKNGRCVDPMDYL